MSEYDAADNGRKCYDLAIEELREIWAAWTVSGICAFNAPASHQEAACMRNSTLLGEIYGPEALTPLCAALDAIVADTRKARSA
jgi:hypothetical protein